MSRTKRGDGQRVVTDGGTPVVNVSERLTSGRSVRPWLSMVWPYVPVGSPYTGYSPRIGAGNGLVPEVGIVSFWCSRVGLLPFMAYAVSRGSVKIRWFESVRARIWTCARGAGEIVVRIEMTSA